VPADPVTPLGSHGRSELACMHPTRCHQAFALCPASAKLGPLEWLFHSSSNTDAVRPMFTALPLTKGARLCESRARRDHAPGHFHKGPGGDGEVEGGGPRVGSTDRRAPGIRSSGDGNADLEFRHSLRPQSLDRPSRAAVRDRTLRYSDSGVLGLAKDKKAILVMASGGVFTEGPWRPWDFVEPYLRQI
jgi:hypothetical protein